MSKGSKMVNVRFPDAELDAMMAEVARYNSHPQVEVKTLSDWIRTACREKIAYHNRGRQPAGDRKKKASQKYMSSKSVDQSVEKRLADFALLVNDPTNEE